MTGNQACEVEVLMKFVGWQQTKFNNSPAVSLIRCLQGLEEPFFWPLETWGHKVPVTEVSKMTLEKSWPHSALVSSVWTGSQVSEVTKGSILMSSQIPRPFFIIQKANRKSSQVCSTRRARGAFCQNLLKVMNYWNPRPFNEGSRILCKDVRECSISF